MKKKPAFQLDSVLLEEHPAARAWNEFNRGADALSSIDKLVGAPWNKSSIYRLNHAGPDGAAVIAKRARRTNLQVERFVYEVVLPQVPVEGLRYYGFLEEKGSEFSWLFLEEAFGRPYDESTAQHRALASAWLGAFHGTTARLKLGAQLPLIMSKRYLSFLQKGRTSILQSLSDSRLKQDDINVLKQILLHFDVIEKHWNKIELFCGETVPC